MFEPVDRSILAHFAALKDPRQFAKVLYPSREVLLLALAATIAEVDDFVEVTLWGEQHQAFLRRFFRFARGIPSHDMCDVFAAIDPDLFRISFQDRVKDFRDGAPELIAIDRKTSRRSHDHARGRKPLHKVSAWASGSCWCNRRARRNPTRSPPFRCC